MAEIKKPDFTLKSFIKWLRKKPEGRTYHYSDTHDCLVCQFLKAQGFRKITAGPLDVAIGGKSFLLPSRLNRIAVEGEFTFGAALKRALQRPR